MLFVFLEHFLSENCEGYVVAASKFLHGSTGLGDVFYALMYIGL